MGLCSLLLSITGILTVIRGHPQLLFANRKDIRMVNVSSNARSPVTVVARNLDDAAAVDFLYNEGFIFWTDINLEKIMRTTFKQNSSSSANGIITTGLVSPDGLACDWLGKKLYWTDAETNRIEVSNLDGSHRKVLYWQNLDQPRAIALDPFHGYMFWTDWGEVPKIERAGMDGSDNTRAVIVDDNIHWPNGLTLDYEESIIYWADAKLNYIHRCNFEGHFRHVVVSESLPHPFALTLYRDMLYWTDWQTKSIHSCNKNGSLQNQVILQDIDSPMDIHAYEPERQPTGVNPCGTNNGGCSHLCLMSPFEPNYTCACPTGVRLTEDGKTCADGASQMLLLARRTDIRRISLDMPDYTDVVLPLDGIKHAIAIDYDPEDGYVYWTDDEARVIRRALLNGSDSQTLIKTEVDHPDGIAIDWVARNMYWTDTGTDRIEVARLNGSSRKVIISEHLDEPRAICLYPEMGYMWWTDWGKVPKIERAYLDGTNRLTIIENDLAWPNGIAVDFAENKLYWGDAKLDKIEVSNLDGSGRRVLVKDNLPHLFGFSELGDYLYWTDWQRRSIERLSKQPGGERSLIIDQLPDMMGLRAVNVKRGNDTNACGTNNGGCSHLCLYTPKGPQCACPMGLELISMGKKCIVPEAFLLFTTEADIKRMSLSSNHRVVPIPLKGIEKAQAIDFDIGGNKIYWTDLSLQSISRAFMNGSATETIIQFGLISPEGMAVDWVAHNIYWVDSKTNRIEVARLDGSSRRVLVWKDISHPRALALDPPNGHMYWADWSEPPRLERANLDGSNRQIIVEGIGRVYGLTIDYTTQRLYWTDMDGMMIESSDLQGNNRTVVTKEVKSPMALTQYEGRLYWSDWESGTIEKANKTDGAMQEVLHTNVDKVMDIAVYHHSRQSGWNGCIGNNGGCSHLCLALPDKFDTNHTRKCSCPTHYTLNPDNKTCSAPKSFLLFSLKNEIRRLVVSDDSADNEPDVVLPLKGLSKLEALDFDPTTGYVYWIVGGGRSKSPGTKPKPVMIKRAKLDGTMPEVIVSGPASSMMLFDMVIDPYAQTLFWSCSKRNVINFTRIDSKVGGVVVEVENKMPRYLAINPLKGYLYWTNAGNPSTIHRCLYDGTESISLFHSGITRPGPITVDPATGKLYWADLNSQVIESSDPTGGNRRQLFSGKQGTSLRNVNGIAVFSKFLYWVDRNEKLIGRINKNTGGDMTFVQGRVPNLSDIHAAIYIKPEDVKKHPCSRNNGNCSHICIAKADQSAKCTCPINLVLKRDERTCAEKSTCSPDQFTCLTGPKECIPEQWKCDGTAECRDKSDEKDCPICDKLKEFQCEDKTCIKIDQFCDGEKQCSHGEDEQSCCIDPQQKKCVKDDKCYDKSRQCDGVADCEDGSDEVPCELNHQVKESTAQSLSAHVTVAIVIGVFSIAVVLAIVFACRRKTPDTQFDDHDMMLLTRPLYPSETSTTSETQKNNATSGRSKKHDRIKQTVATTSVPVVSDSATPYDRNKLTGASSSGSSAVTQYPKETLNPPPSPVTDRSVCAGEFNDCITNSPSTNRSYKKRRRHHTRPPPTTPCSTDVCEDSEPYFATRNYNNYLGELNYDSDPFPPPPTPRSHYFSDEMMSGPDSPRTERSYFNPYPPPPSPVANSDC